MRLVLLKPRDKTDEDEKGLVGNTILVAQPAPQQIISMLTPSEAEQVSYFNLVYSTGREELAKKAALTVNWAQYLKCARLRTARCPVFASIGIDEAKADTPAGARRATSGVTRCGADAVDKSLRPQSLGPRESGSTFQQNG